MKLSPSMPVEGTEPDFCFGNFRLWPDGTLLRDEVEIHLPPKELGALRFLLANSNRVVTPAELKQALWGEVHVTSDSVPRCMSSLRARLEPEQCIHTIYKRGYRLAGPVHRAGGAPSRGCRLVIMPFVSGPNVGEHLGPSIADEVTARVTATGPWWVSVLARDSVFTLAHRGYTAVQVGEALEADLVMTGTLLALPTHFRLRVEMIRVQDGTQVWVEDMLAGRNDILELESELVERLVFRLEGESEPRRGAAAGKIHHPDAHEIFLRGHYEWRGDAQHLTPGGMEHLIEATELDPSLLTARVELAHLCFTQEFYGFLAPHAAAKQTRHICDSISDIGSKAPALLPMLGWMNFHFDRDLEGALDQFSASADLPHSPSTTRARLMFALSRQRFDEAQEWLRPALIEDPYAPWLHACLAWTQHLADEPGKSVETIERALAQFPEHETTQLWGAVILSFNGQAERGAKLAQDLVRRTPSFDLATAIHAYTLACGGQKDEAYRVLERLQWLSRERFVIRSFTAAAFAALGAKEEAISELKAADEMRCPWYFQMLADPRLEPLRGMPEFEQMRMSSESMETPAESSLEFKV